MENTMISIYIDYKLQRFQSQIRYAFEYALSALGYNYLFVERLEQVSENDVLIMYGYTEPTSGELQAIARKYITIFIQSEPDLFDETAYTAAKLKSNLRKVNLLSPTLVISARSFDYPAVNYTEDGLKAGRITFDLVANIFFRLAMREEALNSAGNENYVLADSQSVFRDNMESPAVDNLLWLLDSMIVEYVRSSGTYTSKKLKWPKGEKAAVCLTHSVDTLQKWSLSSLLLGIADDVALFFTFRWGRLWHEMKGKLKYLFTNYELYWNFEEYRSLEREAKVKSSWFFASEACEDIDYSLDDADLLEEIQNLDKEKCEIGLLATADKLNRDDFLSRKQVLIHLLHKTNIGIRQLRYKTNAKILELHSKLSPAYGQSHAPDETPGFKYGFGLPWMPWVAKAQSGFWEIPIVLRDRYLMVNYHKELPLDDAKRMVKKIFQQCIKSGSVMGIDMSVAAWTDISYMEKLYPYILEMIGTADTWITSPGKIAEWWQKRAAVTVDESLYEVSVSFADDMESFTLQLIGDVRIKEILDGNQPELKYEKATAKDNIISFGDVKAGDVVVMRIDREGQGNGKAFG